MSQYAPHRHDIILQNPDGQFIAVIEVKNLPDLSRDVATILRSNSMTYTLLPQTPYFLLLSQDKGFLWKEAWRERPRNPSNLRVPNEPCSHSLLEKRTRG